MCVNNYILANKKNSNFFHNSIQSVSSSSEPYPPSNDAKGFAGSVVAALVPAAVELAGAAGLSSCSFLSFLSNFSSFARLFLVSSADVSAGDPAVPAAPPAATGRFTTSFDNNAEVEDCCGEHNRCSKKASRINRFHLHSHADLDNCRFGLGRCNGSWLFSRRRCYSCG